MKNFELLDETLAYIEAFPEDWDQGTWVAPCGTALCFAGNAALIAHPTYVLEVDDDGDFTDYLLNRSRIEVGLIWEVAQDDLGLTKREASDLFNGGNSLARIKRLIARWKRQDPA